MKTGTVFLAVLLAASVALPRSHAAQAVTGQAFAGPAGPEGLESGLTASNAPDTKLFADGTRAIDAARWADAAAIFAKVAAQQSDHADGALYWKAYAENKLGKADTALATCAELRSGYPKSFWIDECGALEIEIRARSGKPLAPKAGDDDDLKLLALNSLMGTDEPRAMAMIQEILSGDSSERLKKEAQFILGQHYSDATYAQIVRVSYAEGDVRIARGADNEKATGATWEKVEADTPLETGFSLVTGAGRAEIELEDASTLYLGENSVLTMNDLHTTAGIPYTEMALLSGTVSLYVHPYVAGELFLLRTPTNNFLTKFPEKSYVRIESFTDAMTITPVDGGTPHLPGVSAETVAAGRTLTYRDARLVDPAGAAPDQASLSWEKWAAGRVAQRNAAMAEAMKASGLTMPIPGLAEMAGQGTFYECEPYGTCWEPAAAAAGPAGGAPGESTQASAAALARSGRPSRAASGAAAPVRDDDEEFFPCWPSALRYALPNDPRVTIHGITGAAALLENARYDWAVCHAGGWIHRHHRYVWVAGHKRHHLPPFRWVKSGHKIAFVPLHPYDVKGRPPINRRDVGFSPGGKNGRIIEPVRFDPARPIEILKSPPREFRTEHLPPLGRIDPPHIAAHPIKDAQGGRESLARAPGVPIHFDAKSQNFVMARQQMNGIRSTTVFAPISNRGGNLQSHGPSFSGSGGGSHGGGSVAGGGSHGGGGGGGSHSGGGGSSGGGSHSGGGGGTSSAGSSSSGSSSGGGSHK